MLISEAIMELQELYIDHGDVILKVYDPHSDEPNGRDKAVTNISAIDDNGTAPDGNHFEEVTAISLASV